jgi:hypothetical protein
MLSLSNLTGGLSETEETRYRDAEPIKGDQIMKCMELIRKFVFVILSFTMLMLTGCGGSSSALVFTANLVSGNTFAYSTTSGSSGTLAFNSNGTWNATIAQVPYSGTWTVNPAGKLVCITTAGGNYTNTYTLLTTGNPITASVVEVNPSDPNNPIKDTVSLSLAGP